MAHNLFTDRGSKLAELSRGFMGSKRIRTTALLSILTLMVVTFTYHSTTSISGPATFKNIPTAQSSSLHRLDPAKAGNGTLGKPSVIFPPLLGATFDAQRMWYPPQGEDKDWFPVPSEHNTKSHAPYRTRTPILVPFTRNNDMLLQTVVSLIGAGWPREDIIVIDNSGTMDANPLRALTIKNPFYLDVHKLRSKFGIGVLQTPTLLSFSQLQNFMLRLAMNSQWKFYFWCHSDIIVTSDEFTGRYKSFHERIIEELDDVGLLNGQKIRKPRLAGKMFNGDYLAMVHVEPWKEVGGWDTFIPYYSSDCDFYARAKLSGFVFQDVFAGRIFDVGQLMPDIDKKLFRKTMVPLEWSFLFEELEKMEKWKEDHRNMWQTEQTEGKGEPWTYDPEGFQKMWWWWSRSGKDMYEKKWGTRECDPTKGGGKLGEWWKKLTLIDKWQDWRDSDLPGNGDNQ
jgi:hypothetical protein